jgi:hypothetical protein
VIQKRGIVQRAPKSYSISCKFRGAGQLLKRPVGSSVREARGQQACRSPDVFVDRVQTVDAVLGVDESLAAYRGSNRMEHDRLGVKGSVGYRSSLTKNSRNLIKVPGNNPLPVNAMRSNTALQNGFRRILNSLEYLPQCGVWDYGEGSLSGIDVKGL